MRITLQFLQERFDHFNRLIFTPQLPPIRLVVSRGKRQLGCFRHPRVRPADEQRGRAACSISVSGIYDRRPEEFEDILIHEMIHYFVWLNRVNEPSHGPEFRRVMNMINKQLKRNITITEHLSEEVKSTDRRLKQHTVVLADMPNGEKAFACVASSALASVEKALNFNKLPHKWYTTNDPWFNNYPTVRTPKLFNITLNDLQAHFPNINS